MARRFALLLALLVSIGTLVGGCWEQRATPAETIGTYHGRIPPGMATLVINEDNTWEYHIEAKKGQPEFRRTGRWRPDTYAAGAISLEMFEFGFRRFDEEPDPPWPYLWTPFFEKYWWGARVCIFELEHCFSKIDQASPPKTG